MTTSKNSWAREESITFLLIVVFSEEHNLESLEEDYSKVEIKIAVWDLASDKAPGLFEFSIIFFKKLWNLVKPIIFELDE